jgi:putative hemolysin
MKFSHCLWICGLAFVGNSAMAGSTSSVGPANPAAVLCVALQGALETLADETGNQFGMCAIDNGRIGDWTLWYFRNGQEVHAASAFLVHPPFRPTSDVNGGVIMPNPSSQYCVQVGGENVSLYSPGGESGMCRFSDGSTIDGWTLFLGPDVYKGLAAVLRQMAN